MEPTTFDMVLNAFREYPGILALLIIIYFLFRTLRDKDQVIKDFLQISQGDTERMTKLSTLLEILVNRKEAEK